MFAKETPHAATMRTYTTLMAACILPAVWGVSIDELFREKESRALALAARVSMEYEARCSSYSGCSSSSYDNCVTAYPAQTYCTAPEGVDGNIHTNWLVINHHRVVLQFFFYLCQTSFQGELAERHFLTWLGAYGTGTRAKTRRPGMR